MRSLILALLATSVAAARLPSTRRAVLGSSFAAALAAAPMRAARASKKGDMIGDNGSGCTMGDGEGCAALAEGNDYILALQAKSRANRQKNEEALYEKTIANLGYDDFFTTVGKVMVKNGDGTYSALTQEEYSVLRKAGRIDVGGAPGVDVLKGE